MATLRFRNDKWQVKVRRLGYQARTQSFLNKTDAQRWARHVETELDRTLIPNDVRTLAKVTLAELLIRYRDTVTVKRRGLLPEKKRIEAFLRQDWCAYPLAKLNARYFSAYRDDRLKCVGPGTVIRELGLLRSIFETARREWGYSSLDNPLASIRKPKAPNGRERRLEPGELAGLSTACATVRSTLLLHGIHMAIETGMRRGELLAIQWKHVNFDTGVLHIPVTKTGKPRSIPLTDRARGTPYRAQGASRGGCKIRLSSQRQRIPSGMGTLQATCGASRLYWCSGTTVSRLATRSDKSLL